MTRSLSFSFLTAITLLAHTTLSAPGELPQYRIGPGLRAADSGPAATDVQSPELKAAQS